MFCHSKCLSHWWSLLKTSPFFPMGGIGCVWPLSCNVWFCDPLILWFCMMGMFIQFLDNLPVPSLAHWNSGWISPLQVVNISVPAALSGTLSVSLPVPKIALSCRKSDFYNAHSMFTSSEPNVTFCLSPCLSAWHLEWENSETAVLSESWSSSRAHGTVSDPVLRQLQFGFPEDVFLGMVASYPSLLQEIGDLFWKNLGVQCLLAHPVLLKLCSLFFSKLLV